MSGLYIHIPFCRRKCLYCDFYSGGVRIADWRLYIDSILNEFRLRKEEIQMPPLTLYLGGGTPSLIPSDGLRSLIEEIRKISGAESWDEFTIEVNPEDVSDDNCKAWRNCGVNRVSLGIQSLNNPELEKIGRRHDSVRAIDAFETIRKYFDNISVDIISGLPGQTPDSYYATLNKITSLEPEHISSYSLMLEEGTSLTLLANAGKIILPSEETVALMHDMTVNELKNKGYLHYELSNYAKPGFESKHNTGYWTGKAYIGLGPGAHSYDGDGIRRANPCDLKGYMKYFSGSKELLNKDYPDSRRMHKFFDEENLTDDELREEMIMTRLRLKEGLDLDKFKERFGEKSFKQLMENAIRYIENGKMGKENQRLFFNENAILISNLILSDLI